MQHARSRPAGAAASRRLAAAFSLFVLPLLLLPGCRERIIDPLDEHGLMADMSGERESAFRGDASFVLEDGVFQMQGEGTGHFVGHEMLFIGGQDGVLEVEDGRLVPGTYPIGQDPDDEEAEPGLTVVWEMAIAVFTATEGEFTITTVTDEQIEGVFTFEAERTAVCNSWGDCFPQSGDQPINPVEGAFRVAASN